MPPLQRLTARVLGVLMSVVVAHLFKIDLPIGLIINILIVIFVLYLIEKRKK
ncbi:hypothetical protein ABQD56_05425 [Vagococcus fluvialis]|uniref:hypothetical protein n=1 Tax=Vagococcus fluvialis TaxID=2738 RepID=UPI0028355C53|nr:hypothetical protein [Vagococcus sp.]